MTELADIFDELGLTQYLDSFLEHGFDTWDTILDITEPDFDVLGVKLGHRRKLQRRIAATRGISNAQALSSPKRSTPSLDDKQSEESKGATPRSEGRESNSSTQPSGKRKYRRHPKPDENAPERPPSAYVIFSNKMREDLKGRSLSFTEIAKLVGFINNCAQDLYIGAQGDPLPAGGGFKLQAGQTLAFSIVGNTKAARFWPRTGCHIDSNGHLNCETGHCPLPPAGYTASNDGTHCVVGSAQVGGMPPATIAEFTLGGSGPIPNFPDFYDLSLVDGFNVPIEITPISGSDVQGVGRFSCAPSACKTFDCAKVPPELQIKNSNGDIIACSSICIAVNNATQRSLHPSTLGAIWTATDPVLGHPMKDLVCCSCGNGKGGCDSPSCEYGCSPWNTPSPNEVGGKCNVNTWPVGSDGQRYQEAYSSQCPDAYSWQFDDHQATFQCTAPDYKISFCPALEAKSLLGNPASVPKSVDSGTGYLYPTAFYIAVAIMLNYIW